MNDSLCVLIFQCISIISLCILTNTLIQCGVWSVHMCGVKWVIVELGGNWCDSICLTKPLCVYKCVGMRWYLSWDFIPIRTHTVKHIYFDILLTACSVHCFWQTFYNSFFDSDLTTFINIYVDMQSALWYNRVYLKALEGNVYSNKDMWMDALGGVAMGAAFLILYIAASYADLAIVGL